MQLPGGRNYSCDPPFLLQHPEGPDSKQLSCLLPSRTRVGGSSWEWAAGQIGEPPTLVGERDCQSFRPPVLDRSEVGGLSGLPLPGSLWVLGWQGDPQWEAKHGNSLSKWPLWFALLGLQHPPSKPLSTSPFDSRRAPRTLSWRCALPAACPS